MPTTGSGKFPYPNSSAIPDVPADVLLLAQRIATIASGFTLCADATARAALVTNSDAYEGLHVYQIDTKVEYLYTSSAWKAWNSDWITYTATLSSTGGGSFTVGTGGSASQVTQYRYVNGKVEVKWKFVLGSSGAAVPTEPNFTLPVTAAALAHSYQFYSGNGSIFDTSATALRMAFNIANISSTTVTRIAYIDNVAGAVNYPTATVPWTWAAGDAMQGEFSYVPA